MNVIITNKYQAMLSNLEIEVIKTLNGEFEVDEIISIFSNFYFNKMILDITAIKNYKDINNIQRLSISLDMNKVILLLDDSMESSSTAYLSQLISIGIYNFARDNTSIMYMYNHPNSYKDVAHLHQINATFVNPAQPMPGQRGMMQQAPVNMGPVPMQQPVQGQVPMQGQPMQQTPQAIQQVQIQQQVQTVLFQQQVIGFKNITEHAGSSSLVYMIKKQIEKNYKVVAIEIGKRDFMYFNDKDLISIEEKDAPNKVKKYIV